MTDPGRMRPSDFGEDHGRGYPDEKPSVTVGIGLKKQTKPGWFRRAWRKITGKKGE